MQWFQCTCDYCGGKFGSESIAGSRCGPCVEAMRIRKLWVLDELIAFYEGPEMLERVHVVERYEAKRRAGAKSLAELLAPLSAKDLERIERESEELVSAIGNGLPR